MYCNKSKPSAITVNNPGPNNSFGMVIPVPPSFLKTHIIAIDEKLSVLANSLTLALNSWYAALLSFSFTYGFPCAATCGLLGQYYLSQFRVVSVPAPDPYVHIPGNLAQDMSKHFCHGDHSLAL